MSGSSEKKNSADPRTRQFLKLLAQHEKRLAACILALVPNWADADEILQETKLRLWEQFDQYDPERDFGAWSRSIARYQVRTYFKRATRRPVHYGDEFLDSVCVEMDALANQASERRYALFKCIELLNDIARNLLQHCYASGSTIKSVAKELGRTPDSVYRAVGRIRQNLSKCVEDRLHTEDAR